MRRATFPSDCVPEWMLGAYVDDGVEATEVRRIESHLIGCESCRRMVMALREEAGVLGDVLRREARPASDEAVLEAPAKGLLTGLPVGIAVAVGLATVVSIAFETRLPAAIDWLHPARFMRVSDMFWNLVFVLRDDASGFLEFVVGIGALASVAALATFVAGALSKRFTGTVTLAGVLLMVAPVPADAAIEVRRDQETIHIHPEERIDGMLFASGETIVIDGTIDGDVILFGERIEMNGIVEGNLIAGGDDVQIGGEVRGNVYAGGDELGIDGTVTGSAVVGTGYLTLGKSGSVANDLVAGAGRAKVAGEVGRDAAIGTRELDWAGVLGRDLLFGGEELRVTGEIAGDIEAHVRDESGVVIDPAARHGGELRVEVDPEVRRSRWAHYSEAHFWIWRVVWLAGAFVVGLLLYWLAPALFRIRVETAGDFGKALGVGVVAIPVALVVILLLAVTIVGLPLAILALVALGIAVYLAFLVVAAVIGRHVTSPSHEGLREFGLSLLVGLVVLTVLLHIPYVGDPARWVLLFAGVGLLALRLRESLARREQAL